MTHICTSCWKWLLLYIIICCCLLLLIKTSCSKTCKGIFAWKCPRIEMLISAWGDSPQPAVAWEIIWELHSSERLTHANTILFLKSSRNGLHLRDVLFFMMAIVFQEKALSTAAFPVPLTSPPCSRAMPNVQNCFYWRLFGRARRLN